MRSIGNAWPFLESHPFLCSVGVCERTSFYDSRLFVPTSLKSVSPSTNSTSAQNGRPHGSLLFKIGSIISLPFQRLGSCCTPVRLLHNA